MATSKGRRLGCLLPLARSLQALHTALPRPEDSLPMP